jgi:acetyl/propionyl-CoA carboxylase alpha subunit
MAPNQLYSASFQRFCHSLSNVSSRVLFLLVVRSQGTIVEWTAEVGQAVHVDDIVALVETDKVTVELKANLNGVITKQFGAV